MNEQKLRKRFYYFSIFVLLIAVTMLLYLPYLYFFDGNPPIEYYDAPFKASISGNYVSTTISYCRNVDKYFTSYVSFVDGIVVNLPPERVGGTSVGCGNITKFWKIPSELPDGVYYLVVRNEMEVNKLATRSVTYTTTKFNVSRGLTLYDSSIHYDKEVDVAEDIRG